MDKIQQAITRAAPRRAAAPMCKIQKTPSQSEDEDSDWPSLMQRLRTLKTSIDSKRWFRPRTSHTTDLSERVSARHRALIKHNKLYRALAVLSHLFGAYDDRIPKAYRGGMIKSVHWFMNFERRKQ